MSKSCQIPWKPFSDKHKIYIAQAINSRLAVAEGAIRSGKTIDNCIIAAMYLDTCEDKIHLASGSTVANAKMNIGDCNGFGLQHLFRGRCRWGKYKDMDALYIKARAGTSKKSPIIEKIVIFTGGGKKDSFRKILGNSYGLWIGTEINQHYDSDDSDSFIKVAFGRQAAAKRPLTLWDLNPSSPNHPIYKKYIDLYMQKGLEGGYTYMHFTMNDNLSIDEVRRKQIASLYVKGSIWYRRDILGERCNSEGLIYTAFAAKPDSFRLKANQLPPIIVVECGVDFGGNGSAQAFVAVGYTYMYRDVIVLDSKRITEQVDSEQLNAHFIAFARNVYNKYSKSFNTNYDNSEVVLGNSLRSAVIQNRLPIQVKPAIKSPILQRIRLVTTLMAQHRFWILEGNKTVESALESALWNKDKPDERLDNGTTDIDTLDALEYAIEKHYANLITVLESFVTTFIAKKGENQ